MRNNNDPLFRASQVMRIGSAAKAAGVTRWAIVALVGTGKIATIEIDGVSHVYRSDIETYREARYGRKRMPKAEQVPSGVTMGKVKRIVTLDSHGGVSKIRELETHFDESALPEGWEEPDIEVT